MAAYMYVPKAKENRYWAATASFNDIPQTAVNSVETVSAVLNLQSPAMTFYKTVNVTTPAVQVTGVTLNETKLDLDAGETAQLVAEVTPADATYKQVTWSSSNEEVAKVSADGLVTAMAGAGGTTIITCTTVDGGKTATCEVTETVA
ncbi:Ig domain-containing protein [Enterobacter hormaechei]